MSSDKGIIPVEDGMAKLLHEVGDLKIYLHLSYSKEDKRFSKHRVMCFNVLSVLLSDKTLDTSHTISVNGRNRYP